MAFTISYEYTGEIYPTRHRAKGLGMAGAYSRIGGILMPWIGIYISKVGKYLPYLIFGISSGLGTKFKFIYFFYNFYNIFNIISQCNNFLLTLRNQKYGPR